MIDRADLDSKIALLRLKHRDNNDEDTSADTAFMEEFVEWLKTQPLNIDHYRMAIEATEDYNRRHSAYANLGKKDTQNVLDIFEDEGLISLSLERSVHITMGDAIAHQWPRHNLVLNQEFGRQVKAFQRKSEFVGVVMEAAEDPNEKGRDLIARLKAQAAQAAPKKKAEDEREAAD
jgi:hypothetical protein